MPPAQGGFEAHRLQAGQLLPNQLLDRLDAFEAVACRARMRSDYYDRVDQKAPVAILGLVIRDAAHAFLPPSKDGAKLTNNQIHQHLCETFPGEKWSVKLTTFGTFLEGKTRVREGGSGEQNWFERFESWLKLLLLSRPAVKPEAAPAAADAGGEFVSPDAEVMAEDDLGWVHHPQTGIETKSPKSLSQEAKDRVSRIVSFFLPPDYGRPPAWFSDDRNPDKFWASSEFSEWAGPCCMKELIAELRAAAYFATRVSAESRPEIIRVSGWEAFPFRGHGDLETVYRDANTHAAQAGVPTRFVVAKMPKESGACESAVYFGERTARKATAAQRERMNIELFEIERADFLMHNKQPLDDHLSPSQRWLYLRVPICTPAEIRSKEPIALTMSESLVVSQLAGRVRAFSHNPSETEVKRFLDWFELVRSKSPSRNIGHAPPAPLDSAGEREPAN